MIKLNLYKDKRQGNVKHGKVYARAKNNKPSKFSAEPPKFSTEPLKFSAEPPLKRAATS